MRVRDFLHVVEVTRPFVKIIFEFDLEELFYYALGPVQIHKLLVQRVLAFFDEVCDLFSRHDAEVIEVLFFRFLSSITPSSE